MLFLVLSCPVLSCLVLSWPLHLPVIPTGQSRLNCIRTLDGDLRSILSNQGFQLPPSPRYYTPGKGLAARTLCTKGKTA